MRQSRRRITLLMDLVGNYGRGLYDGITKYATMVGNWEFWLEPSTVWREKGQPWDWEVDGALIFGLWTPEVIAALRRGVPMVNLTSVASSYPVLTIDVDHCAVGEMGARYFLERGFRHLGFVGMPNSSHSTFREKGFKRAIGKDAAFHPYVTQWEEDRPIWPEPMLVKWLQEVPKPIGVFVANDERATQVLDACHAARLAVPEQVAVLGVDNDEISRKRHPIGLSTIELPATRVGYEAAAALDCLMSGRKPKVHMKFAPMGTITRESTQTSQVSDPSISLAIHYIRSHAPEPIGVPDIAANVGISKRSLEQRFKKVCGLSPVQFLTRARVEHAKRLLVETDLKMPVIARRSGFSDASHLGVVFRRNTGMTLTAYRNQSRIVS